MSNETKTEKPEKTGSKETGSKPAPVPVTGNGAFAAKMKDNKVLKGIVDAVSAVIDETYLVATPAGLNLTAMDESHICLTSINLPAGMFDAYECDGEHAKLGINLADLAKVMKRAGQSDAIEFKHQKDAEKFQVQMKGQGTRTFSLRLVDVDEEKIPPTAELDVDYKAKAAFDVGILEEAVKDAEIYTDTLEINLLQTGLRMVAEGEVGDVDYQVAADRLPECQVTHDGRGVFSIAFLKMMLKISAIADTVTLQVAENAPLRAEFTITNPDRPVKDDKGNTILGRAGRVTYWMAPRVEEENSESYNE